MTAATYRTLTVPRRVRFTADAPQPAAFYARLLSHALNHGLPARRRGGRLVAAAGRRGLPTAVVASGLRLMPRHPAPDLDLLLRETHDRWPDLAGRSRRLRAAPGRLSLLEVERSFGRTIFVFDDGAYPVLVVKVPRAGDTGVRREATALRRAGPSSIAPEFLGEDGSRWIQEGVPGLPLWVGEVGVGNAADLAWTRDFAQLTSALEMLARTTAHHGPAPAELLGALDRAQVPDLSPGQRRLVAAARRDLSRLDLSVLQHQDLSAQNWLVGPSGFVGVVDWETATQEGIPGFDLLHAAVSVFEHGVGLGDWSGPNVTQAFRRAWSTSALFAGARAGLSSTAANAGVGEALLEPLQLAYFARRLGRQVAGRTRYSLDTEDLVDMLRTACAA